MAVRLELFVEDTKRSKEFYTIVLGFQEVRCNPEHDYHAFKRDEVQIGIGSTKRLSENHYFRPEVSQDRKGLGIEIVLEVDDIKKLHEEVAKNDYPIAEPLTKQSWGLTDFRIVDPDGYYLRFTSRQ